MPNFGTGNDWWFFKLDENGLRAILNFGHTIGHALEATYGNAIVTLPDDGTGPRRGVLPAVHCHDHEH